MSGNISYSGLFPWDNFCIHFKDRKLFIGSNNREENFPNDYSIRNLPYTTEYLLRRKPPFDNEIVCIGDYNSYLYDLNTYKNRIVYVSTYAFHPFSNFSYKKMDLIHDGIIVARNDADKRRWLIEKLNHLKIVSAAYRKEPHQPEGFNFELQGSFGLNQICDFYNSSKCSFILSPREGECRSVMESLLSGCPVISTKPKPWTDGAGIFNTLPMNGGRDEVLNPSNCIYCDWTSESVLEAYEKYTETIANYDRQSISIDAHNFMFRCRVQLLKIIHHVIRNKFDADIKEVMNCIKGSDFYLMFENEIKYYVDGICE